MTGVCKDEVACGTNPYAARSCEAKLSLGYEGIVEVKQDLGGVVGRFPAI